MKRNLVLVVVAVWAVAGTALAVAKRSGGGNDPIGEVIDGGSRCGAWLVALPGSASSTPWTLGIMILIAGGALGWAAYKTHLRHEVNRRAIAQAGIARPRVEQNWRPRRESLPDTPETEMGIHIPDQLDSVGHSAGMKNSAKALSSK